MRNTPLTHVQEDYIRAIFILQEAADGPVGVTKIAEYLRLSKPAVSERLKDLAREKLLATSPYGKVRLTGHGLSVAHKITFKHRVAEVFLHTVLKIPKHQVHAEAHRLEHAFSDDTIKRLALYLGMPENDPHGSPIPKIATWNS